MHVFLINYSWWSKRWTDLEWWWIYLTLRLPRCTTPWTSVRRPSFSPIRLPGPYATSLEMFPMTFSNDWYICWKYFILRAGKTFNFEIATVPTDHCTWHYIFKNICAGCLFLFASCFWTKVMSRVRTIGKYPVKMSETRRQVYNSQLKLSSAGFPLTMSDV